MELPWFNSGNNFALSWLEVRDMKNKTSDEGLDLSEKKKINFGTKLTAQYTVLALFFSLSSFDYGFLAKSEVQTFIA